MIVVEEADVVRLHLSPEWCVRSRVFAEAITFGMEFYADFFTILSIWELLAFLVSWVGKFLEPLY